MSHSSLSIQNSAFPRYAAYKDSGVEWLGEIPEHWEVSKTRWIWDEIDDRSENGDEQLLSISQYTGVKPTTTDSRSESLEGYRRCKPDDLAMNIMLAWQGGLGVSDYEGIVSPAYSVFRLKSDNNAHFLGYLYRTKRYLDEFGRNSTGIVPSRWRLYPDKFGHIQTLLPPKPEQDRIVIFLDRKTAKIDALIAKKQRQIELLDEQKAILINRAVTRGLNPNAKLKPSGIKWIGDIPEGWEAVAFRRLIDAICDGPFGSGLTSSHYSDSGTRVIRLGNIRKGEFKNADKAFIPNVYAQKLSHHEVLRDDLLVAGLGDSKNPVGRACVYERDEPAIVKADCYRVRLKNKKLNGFISIYLSSPTGAAGFAAATRGSTRSRVNLEITKEVWVVRPAVKDAIEIESYIASVNSESLKAACSVEAQIQALKTLRCTLIAHAVTGRIKV